MDVPTVAIPVAVSYVYVLIPIAFPVKERTAFSHTTVPIPAVVTPVTGVFPMTLKLLAAPTAIFSIRYRLSLYWS